MKIQIVVILALYLLVVAPLNAQQKLDNNIQSSPDTSHFNNLNLSELFVKGEKLTLAACGSCHFGEDGRLSGKQMEDVPKIFGTVYTANITNDKTFGIGQWTGGQLAYFLRTGIKPDGKKANIVMPRFPNIAEPELEAIIAFLKSDSSFSQSSPLLSPTSRISFTGKLATALAPNHYVYPEKPKNSTDTTQLIAYGDYLVNGVLHCFACHSANIAKVDFKNPPSSKGYLGGGSKLVGMDGDKVLSANLTFDKTTGIGKYSQQQFLDVMRMGRKNNGEWIKPPMLPYTSLSDNDILAIYEYLKVVPVINNKKLLASNTK